MVTYSNTTAPKILLNKKLSFITDGTLQTSSTILIISPTKSLVNAYALKVTTTDEVFILDSLTRITYESLLTTAGSLGLLS